VCLKLTFASLNAEDAGIILKSAIESFNAGHLANATKNVKHRELALVKHVTSRIIQSQQIFYAKKHFKNIHRDFGSIRFLHQPEIDMYFKYGEFLHGVEFKLLGNSSVFYNGIEEALAQSTYGIDFSWIVHFYPMDFEDIPHYQSWMSYTIEHSNCRSIGYIAATTKGCKILIYPTIPFSRLKGIQIDRKKTVSLMRKDLISRLKTEKELGDKRAVLKHKKPRS